jgi:photosystem II stability/assembly factor-like uncharacterized protein
MAEFPSAQWGPTTAGASLPLIPLLLGVLVIGLTLGLGGPAGPDPTAGSAVPATSITPLYLGHGVGIVATYPTFGGGCPRLYSTTDFTRWHNISPPQPPSSVGPCVYVWSSASFISPDEGWVLGRNGGATDTTLYRTVDGGRSWTKEPGSATGSNGGEQVIGFTSPTDGWRQQFATGANGPYLLETTADGGETWTELPQQGTNGGCMFALDAFANPADGYAAPGLGVGFGGPPPQSFLWRTVDGGRTWTTFTLARPAGAAGVAAYEYPPTFLSATVGVLPVSYRTAAGASALAFYVTKDAGGSWTVRATMRSRSAGGTERPSSPSSPSSPSITTDSSLCDASAAPSPPAAPGVAVASPSTWWVMAPGDGRVAVTATGGTTWTHVRKTGLHPAGAVLSSFRAANARVAWVTTSDESVGQRSFQTLDGGRTWTALRPHAAR